MKNLNIAIMVGTLSFSAFAMGEEIVQRDQFLRKEIEGNTFLKFNNESFITTNKRFDEKSLIASLLNIKKVNASIKEDTISLAPKVISGSNPSPGRPLYKIEQVKSANGGSNAIYLRDADSPGSDPKLTLLNGRLYRGYVMLNDAGDVHKVKSKKSNDDSEIQHPLYTVIDNKVYVGEVLKNSRGEVVDRDTQKASLQIEDLAPLSDTNLDETATLLAMTRAGLINPTVIGKMELLVQGDLFQDNGNNKKLNSKARVGAFEIEKPDPRFKENRYHDPLKDEHLKRLNKGIPKNEEF